MRFIDENKTLLLITRIITYLLMFSSLIIILIVLFSETCKYEFRPFNIDNINFFLSFFKNLYPLFGATLSMMIAYLAIKKYVYSKRKDLIQETIKVIDFFNDSIVKNVQGIYSILKDKNIDLTGDYDYSDFTVEALYEKNSLLRDQLNDLIINDSFYKSKEIYLLGQIDAFAAKLKNELIDREFAREIIGKAYCKQIESLYPIISNYRRRDNKTNYFGTLIELFKDWNKE